MIPLIECRNISLGYDNEMVLKDLSFTVEKNDYLSIIGENGSGKSTLIKGLLGFLKTEKGKIKISAGIKKTEIGYLPQMTFAQKNFPASVYEIVLSGCLNNRGKRFAYTKENRDRVVANLEKLKITDLQNKCFSELSGGQQRRVLLARALCSMKKVLILDEPTNGLDAKATGEFYTIIDKMNKEDNITIIMVSHDLRNVLTRGKHILYLGSGENFFGTVNEYKKSMIGDYLLAGYDRD